MIEIDTVDDKGMRTSKCLIDMDQIFIVVANFGWPGAEKQTILRFKGTELFLIVDKPYETFKAFLEEQELQRINQMMFPPSP